MAHRDRESEKLITLRASQILGFTMSCELSAVSQLENKMKKLAEFLKANAKGDLLSWDAHKKAMKEFGLTCRDIDEAALALDILPARYQRNRKTITTALQRKLFQSKVAVIGCGGLGGYIIEELARLGVGTIKAIDPDFLRNTT